MLRLSANLVIIFVFLFLSPFITKAKAQENDNLLTEVNQYRASKGLPVVKLNQQTCNFAQIRAKEAAASFSHDGFYSRVKNGSLPYTYYRFVTENLAWTPKNQDPVVMWINSPDHAANLLKNTPFVCIQKFGNYYAFEGLQI